MAVSVYVVAAIAGNFWQESTLNPGIWESLTVGNWTDLGRGYGLGQWTNTGGDTHGRLYQLHDYLVSNGYAIDSGDGQIAFLMHENYWTSRQEAASFPDLASFLASDSTDIGALTHAWNIGWEGIHDASWDARVGYAQQCYDYIYQHYDDESITFWVSGNRYLSTSERLNNAVMLHRVLNGGISPEPPDPPEPPKTKKDGMPLWMKIRYRK